MGAILEPLSVAIHAVRRAQIVSGDSILVFGAGAVGLLCGAFCKTNSSGMVVIADIQNNRVAFARQHGFADEGIVINAKRGNNIGEKLQIAKDTAHLTCKALDAMASLRQFDIVIECTGVEACTQASIYVSQLIC